MSSNDLAHFGVKGMKWGHRKAEAQNSGYSQDDRTLDKGFYGRGGVKRINRRMNKGMTYTQAHRRENVIQATAAGAAVAVKIVGLAGAAALPLVAKKAEINRGRAAAANLMGIPSKGSSINYSKQRRSGAYNISSL